MRIDRTSRRILGSLIEKRMSTPELYPLTLNAVLLACNQRSNRDPEMQLEEFLVEGCLRQLRIDGWITVVERDTGRSTRYAERMTEKLGLAPKEAAILAELMLRGPQTEQELHRRCERMARIDTFDEALALLEGLATRGFVEHLPRETGQRIARWRHLLSSPGEEDAGPPEPLRAAVPAAAAPAAAHAPAPHAPATAAPPAPRPVSSPVAAPAVVPPAAAAPFAPPAAPPAAPADAGEIAALRREVETLRNDLAALRDDVRRLVGPLTHDDDGARPPAGTPFA